MSTHAPMPINIDHLTERELVELNQRIVQRLQLLQTVHAHRDMMEFTLGQRVSFATHGGQRQTGILTKFNRKTVTVITDDGQRWNVPPQLLSKIKAAGEVLDEPCGAHVHLMPSATDRKNNS